MYKTARNLTLLGTGLSISALVGWFLWRENRRDAEPGAILIKSTHQANDLSEIQNIVLPPEALQADEPESTPAAPLAPPSALPQANTSADDLTLINDIGPRFSEALNAIGITTYRQLAEQTPENLAQRLADHVTVRAQRIHDKNWIGQAAQLAQS